MSKLYQIKGTVNETYFMPIYPVRTGKGEADAITKVNGKWECRKGQYYTHYLRDEEHFPVVGNVKINILGYVMGEMLDALERRTDERLD